MARAVPNNRCAAVGCLNLKHGGWTIYCSRHQMRHTRYGHPLAKAIPDEAFNYAREWIADGLRAYRNTKAMSAALQLARGVLHYEPAQGFKVQRKIAERLRLLRDHGVNELDLIRRVCEFCAYMERHPFPNQRTEDFQLARSVLRLAPIGRYRPSANVLKWLAPEVREACYPFALAFLARLQQDAAKQAALRAECRDFDAPAVSPEAQPSVDPA